VAFAVVVFATATRVAAGVPLHWAGDPIVDMVDCLAVPAAAGLFFVSLFGHSPCLFYFTVRANEALWLTPLEVATTVTLYVPAGVGTKLFGGALLPPDPPHAPQNARITTASGKTHTIRNLKFDRREARARNTSKHAKAKAPCGRSRSQEKYWGGTAAASEVVELV
jgi:hypothetical protein